MAIDLHELSELWLIACADAGFESNTEAVLYVVEGDAGDGAAAIHIEPGSEVCSNSAWPLDPRQLTDANSAARQKAHRIVVRDFSSPRVALGRLRHELEHARQYERSAPVYLGMSVAQHALSRAVELCEPPSWEGSAALYNLLPFEEDANRAAAKLTNAHFGPASDAELRGTDAPLFRDDARVQADTLAMRVLAFSALFPESIIWVAEQNKEELDETLARFGDDARLGWDLLYATPGVRAYGQAALRYCPTEEEINNSPAPAGTWSPVKELIQEGKAVAEEILEARTPALRLH